MEYGSQKSTDNSGVCIKGSTYSTDEIDYYGRLKEVIVIEYPGLPIKRTTLFKCEWFNPSPLGTSVHPELKLVSINHTRRYNKFEPFVLAKQVVQVYYCSYPSKRKGRDDWWEACKIKARPNVEIAAKETTDATTLAYQEDNVNTTAGPIIDDDPLPIHPDGGVIDIIDGDGDDECEEEFIESSDGEGDDSNFD